ncbi:hypothetical protein Tco_1500411 [Tanacetum coccineum]
MNANTRPQRQGILLRGRIKGINKRRRDCLELCEIRKGARTGKKDDSKSIGTIDGEEGKDRASHLEEDEDYLNHLIRDCDFHEKRMAKQAELTMLLKRKVNTVKPIVNNARPKAGFHKSVSPFRKSFNRTTTLRTNFSKQKVNNVEVNAVSAVKGKREIAVKPSAGGNWRPKRHYWHKVSKYNGGSSLRNYATFKDPPGRLKPQKAWVPKRI